ncbi:MAG: DUF262 domain-containing protein [Erysipelotrichales bacterium]|nr:DUF262 domain-containing protein [Erysipelotrichales bacterium]
MMINNIDYTVIDNRIITIADSFVEPSNKLGRGNGEAKLYIGQESDDLRLFYGVNGFKNKCFLLKEDLLRYLYDSQNEYNNPSQPYRSQDEMYSLWENRLKFVNTLNDIFWFFIKEQEQITPPRIYIKSLTDGFKIIRLLSLPNLTELSITKLVNAENEVVYYYKLQFQNFGISFNEEEGEREEYIPIQGVEEEIEEFKPYDTEKISIDTKPLSMDACLRRLEQGTIVLAPDFQRNEVWNIDKKSKLIESLMLKIPIPMFYVSADEKSTFSVVDGLQRLSTIRSFVLGDTYMKTRNPKDKGNGFRLQKLEFWGNKYDNKTFNELPIEIQNRISETQFTFTIINPGTPEEVKRNVFKRINTGGEPLTAQEIRNALYTGEATTLLKKLADKKEFKNTTEYSVKTVRMLDRELVLRALSFMVRPYTSYPKTGDMDRFLSDTMRIINIMPNFNSKESLKLFKEESTKKDGILKEDILLNTTDELEALFIKGMQRSRTLLGKHTFRKSYGQNRRTPINKALLEVWTVLMSKLSDSEFDKLNRKQIKQNFSSEYNKLLDCNSFNFLISRDSLKYQSIQERHKLLFALINKYINDSEHSS